MEEHPIQQPIKAIEISTSPLRQRRRACSDNGCHPMTTPDPRADAKGYGAGLSDKVKYEFGVAYHDLIERECDRTDADLSLLERAGLMFSRVVTNDDSFDSLEPGERVYEFSRAGVLLIKELEAHPPTDTTREDT